MKTPLTITAKVWNYCQNSCRYCVSSSNKKEWKYQNNFGSLPPQHILNFDRLRDWLLLFAPDSELHISGGEPLLRPDIETQVQKLTEAGIRITIFTNGLLIEKRPVLLSLPLKWVVTHHNCNPFALWHRNAILIRSRPHIVSHLGDGDPDDKNKSIYDDFNFIPGQVNGLRYAPSEPCKDDLNVIASDVIHLIIPDGRIYACNSQTTFSIGNIHTMTYDKNMARLRNSRCRQCVIGRACPAYQTARLTYSLKIPGEL